MAFSEYVFPSAWDWFYDQVLIHVDGRFAERATFYIPGFLFLVFCLVFGGILLPPYFRFALFISLAIITYKALVLCGFFSFCAFFSIVGSLRKGSGTVAERASGVLRVSLVDVAALVAVTFAWKQQYFDASTAAIIVSAYLVVKALSLVPALSQHASGEIAVRMLTIAGWLLVFGVGAYAWQGLTLDPGELYFRSVNCFGVGFRSEACTAHYRSFKLKARMLLNEHYPYLEGADAEFVVENIKSSGRRRWRDLLSDVTSWEPPRIQPFWNFESRFMRVLLDFSCGFTGALFIGIFGMCYMLSDDLIARASMAQEDEEAVKAKLHVVKRIMPDVTLIYNHRILFGWTLAIMSKAINLDVMGVCGFFLGAWAMNLVRWYLLSVLDDLVKVFRLSAAGMDGRVQKEGLRMDQSHIVRAQSGYILALRFAAMSRLFVWMGLACVNPMSLFMAAGGCGGIWLGLQMPRAGLWRLNSLFGLAMMAGDMPLFGVLVVALGAWDYFSGEDRAGNLLEGFLKPPPCSLTPTVLGGAEL